MPGNKAEHKDVLLWSRRADTALHPHGCQQSTATRTGALQTWQLWHQIATLRCTCVWGGVWGGGFAMGDAKWLLSSVLGAWEVTCVPACFQWGWKWFLGRLSKPALANVVKIAEKAKQLSVNFSEHFLIWSLISISLWAFLWAQNYSSPCFL